MNQLKSLFVVITSYPGQGGRKRRKACSFCFERCGCEVSSVGNLSCADANSGRNEAKRSRAMARYYDGEKEYMSAVPILVARSGHSGHGDLPGGVVGDVKNGDHLDLGAYGQASGGIGAVRDKKDVVGLIIRNVVHGE